VVTRWIHTSLLGAIATKRACLRFSRACFNPRCLLPLVASTLPADPPLLGPASLLLPTGHRSEHPRECTWLLASWQKIDFCTRIECCRMQEIPLTMITTVWFASTAIFFISQYNLRVSKIKNHYFISSYLK
jgi:hypothetical protein